jgi:hypothetical protein
MRDRRAIVVLKGRICADREFAGQAGNGGLIFFWVECCVPDGVQWQWADP